jgi:long-chain acyl-CoA synthetase
VADEKPWLKHYDPPVPRSLAPYPDKPVFALLEETAARYPDRPCTLFKGRAITYRKMNQLSDRMAAALAGLGVKKGDRVGICMPNTPQFVIAYYGILKAGGVVVGVNPLYTPRELEYQLQDSGTEILAVMSNFYRRVKEAQPRTNLKRLVVTRIQEQLPRLLGLLFRFGKARKGGHQVELAAGDVWMKDLLARYSPSDRPPVLVTGSDRALLQYSGGTTGLSKGAVITHNNLVANALQIRTWFHDTQEGQERLLEVMPLFHVYGMVAGMLFATLAGGGMVMVPNPRDLKDVIGNINKYQPSFLMGVQTLYNAINNHPDVKSGKCNPGSIRHCISGAAPLLLETKQTFERLTGGKLVEGYGLSEAPTATHCNPLRGLNKPGSIGLPLPDVECRVVSIHDGVTALGPDEIGELTLRGPQVFQGYWNQPEETAQALRAGPAGGPPWLHTGDIARMDEDGYFYIVDRKKDLIKPGGLQVWPREVEEVLAAHPKVKEAGVAGVRDAQGAEVVKAWIVLNEGEHATKGEIRSFCTGKLASFKIPGQIEFCAELPKTHVGKVLRRELVRQEREKTAAAIPSE